MTTKVRSFKEGYVDHNGNFVSQIFYNKDPGPGNKSQIASRLLELLEKKGVYKTSHVSVYSDHYPEDEVSSIYEYYDKQGVSTKILSSKNTYLGGDPEFDFISHNMRFPLWYMVYMYMVTYSHKADMNKYRHMTKKELVDILTKDNEKSGYINHEIMMMDLATGMVIDIGS